MTSPAVSQPTDNGVSALLKRFQADAYAGLKGEGGASIGGGPGDPGATAGASFGAGLELVLGRLADRLEADERGRRRELMRRLQGCAPVWLPPVPYTATNGVLNRPDNRTSSAELAPQDGYVWFLTHLVVAGLQANAAGAGTTLSNFGSVTNPTAGQNIVTLALPAGTWLVNVFDDFQGTITAADLDNFQVTSSPLIAGLPAHLPANITSASAAENGLVPIQVVVPIGGATLQVQAIANASGAAAVYRSGVYATPVAGTAGDTVTLSKANSLGLNNYLHTFSAAAPDWQASSSSLFLLPDDNLVLSGSGLQAGQVVLSGQAIQIESALVADYLM